MEQFDFVFHIALKFAKQNQTLQDLIVEQHAVLKRQNVSQYTIRQILQEEISQRKLLLMDGYDEYKVGTSPHIDDVLKRGLSQSVILLTSRDTKEVAELKPYMDLEAEIIGFGPTGVRKYTTKYLGSEEMQIKLYIDALGNQIIQYRKGAFDFGIMQVPIFLHMICVLFQRKNPFPATKTGIISAIVKRCPDWEEVRKSGKKTDDEWKAALDTALLKLGKFAWQQLLKGDKRLMFTKVMIPGSAVILGILFHGHQSRAHNLQDAHNFPPFSQKSWTRLALMPCGWGC